MRTLFEEKYFEEHQLPFSRGFALILLGGTLVSVGIALLFPDVFWFSLVDDSPLNTLLSEVGQTFSVIAELFLLIMVFAISLLLWIIPGLTILIFWSLGFFVRTMVSKDCLEVKSGVGNLKVPVERIVSCEEFLGSFHDEEMNNRLFSGSGNKKLRIKVLTEGKEVSYVLFTEMPEKLIMAVEKSKSRKRVKSK